MLALGAGDFDLAFPFGDTHCPFAVGAGKIAVSLSVRPCAFLYIKPICDLPCKLQISDPLPLPLGKVF